jgi:hypothetical protein
MIKRLKPIAVSLAAVVTINNENNWPIILCV